MIRDATSTIMSRQASCCSLRARAVFAFIPSTIGPIMTNNKALFSPNLPSGERLGSFSISRSRRARQWNMLPKRDDSDSTAFGLLESSLKALGRPLPLPFISSNSGRRQAAIPLAYPLALAGIALVVPPLTWALLILFFGGYLALLGAFMDGDGEAFADEPCNNQNGGQMEEYELEQRVVPPLAAFTGAFASAALLSPQGLHTDGAAAAPSFSLSVAIMALGLGGAVISKGITEYFKDRELLKDQEERRNYIRKETTKLDQWDQQLEDRFRRREEE